MMKKLLIISCIIGLSSAYIISSEKIFVVRSERRIIETTLDLAEEKRSKKFKIKKDGPFMKKIESFFSNNGEANSVNGAKLAQRLLDLEQKDFLKINKKFVYMLHSKINRWLKDDESSDEYEESKEDKRKRKLDVIDEEEEFCE